ncbi:MAG TPA: hypothetical protein VEX38_05015 [Fimbriimonadaceae bacterium]|nr:hypothetical protein [Fimbriimonadaceae bacterium]
MKSYIILFLALAALVLTGCSGGDEKAETPPPGTPEIREAPKGTPAPGDTRGNPAASDEARG